MSRTPLARLQTTEGELTSGWIGVKMLPLGMKTTVSLYLLRGGRVVRSLPTRNTSYLRRQRPWQQQRGKQQSMIFRRNSDGSTPPKSGETGSSSSGSVSRADGAKATKAGGEGPRKSAPAAAKGPMTWAALGMVAFLGKFIFLLPAQSSYINGLVDTILTSYILYSFITFVGTAVLYYYELEKKKRQYV